MLPWSREACRNCDGVFRGQTCSFALDRLVFRRSDGPREPDDGLEDVHVGLSKPGLLFPITIDTLSNKVDKACVCFKMQSEQHKKSETGLES